MAEPRLRVVRGDATPEEIAALVATLAAAQASAEPAPRRAAGRSEWNAPARRLRATAYPSAGGWRRSGLP